VCISSKEEYTINEFAVSNIFPKISNCCVLGRISKVLARINGCRLG